MADVEVPAPEGSDPPPESEATKEPVRDREEGPSSHRAPDADSSESPSERQYDPEAEWLRRSERERGAANFSDTAYNVSSRGDGAPAAGFVQGNVIGTINIGRGSRAHLVQEISRPNLERTWNGFVEVLPPGKTRTAKDTLVEYLSTRRVVVVAGLPGSGRTELAVRALHTHLPPDSRIAAFRLGRSVNQLREMQFRKNDGYVVDLRPDLTGRSVKELVAEIEGQVEKSQSVVVITVDLTLLPPGTQDYPVLQLERISAWVTLETLLQRVHHRSVEDLALLRNTPLESEIETASMAELASSAAAIAAALAAGKEPGAFLRSILRESIGKKFDHPTVGTVEADTSTTDELRESATSRSRKEQIRTFQRCCMLAAAVFNGLPLQITMDAAAELGAVLRSDSLDVMPISDLFGQPIESLLNWLDAELSSTAGTAEPRRLTFRNPAVPDVVLEHVWTSHHLAGASIAIWLDQLALVHRDGYRGPEEVRLRAAQAVGRLAIYDFRYVMDEVVEPWIRSETLSGVQAASWAIEIMVKDQRVAAPAWERVRFWGRRGKIWRRAALMVYANSLDPSQVDDAIDLVKRVALIDMPPDYAATAVLHNAVVAGATEQVFQVVLEWLDMIDQAREKARKIRHMNKFKVVSSLPSHAARALILLGAGDETGTRAKLLHASRENPELRIALVRLWGMALNDAAVTARATTLLRTWFEDLETKRDLVSPCREALIGFQADPALRRRIYFHAERWISEWDGLFPTAEKILRQELGERR